MVDFRCRVTGVVALAVLGGGPSITLSSDVASGAGPGPGVTTSSVTVFSTPAASAWNWIFVSGGAITAGLPTSQTTNWGATGLALGELRSAIYRCEVTINGSVYLSPAVTVGVERYP